MYIPHVQPTSLDFSGINSGIDAIRENRLLKGVQDLTQVASGEGPEADVARNKLLALNPRAAAAIQEDRVAKRNEAGAVVLGGITALSKIQDPAQKAQFYEHLLPQIQAQYGKYLPDIMNAPPTYDENYINQLGIGIAARGGESGKLGTAWAQGQGLLPADSGQSGFGVAGPGGRIFNRKTGQWEGEALPFGPKVVSANQLLTGPVPSSGAAPSIPIRTGPANAPLEPGMPGYDPTGIRITREGQTPVTPSGTAEPSGVTPQQPATPPVPTQQQLIEGRGKIKEAEKKGADTGELMAKKPLAAASLRDATANIDMALTKVDDLLSPTNKEGVAGITGLAGSLPNVKDITRNTAATLKSLTSQAMVQVITALKTASSTGATGFGQLSEKEGDILRNWITTLDLSDVNSRPGAEKFLKNLQDLKVYMNGLKGRLATAYDQTYGAEAVPNSAADVTGTPQRDWSKYRK